MGMCLKTDKNDLLNYFVQKADNTATFKKWVRNVVILAVCFVSFMFAPCLIF